MFRLFCCVVFLVLTLTAGSDCQTPSPSPTPDPNVLAAIKEHNALAIKLNESIVRYNSAIAASNWDSALAAVDDLIAASPQPEFYIARGHIRSVKREYALAITAYETANDLYIKHADRQKLPAGDKLRLSNALVDLGNCYLRLKDSDKAIKWYNEAAALSPNPGLAYFNLCATQYNIGSMDAAIVSCEKSINADPTRADAYFIKGSALFGNGKIDTNGKYVLPPGTVQALKKYLELAPNGAHSADVKAMLESAR